MSGVTNKKSGGKKGGMAGLAHAVFGLKAIAAKNKQ
jgi:hypothetical protein